MKGCSRRKTSYIYPISQKIIFISNHYPIIKQNQDFNSSSSNPVYIILFTLLVQVLHSLWPRPPGPHCLSPGVCLSVHLLIFFSL